jgi:thymidylate synthase
VHVIQARNVNDAFRQALKDLSKFGVRRDSRNGPVLMYPEPVTTVYEKPLERVLFWAERDANPFFHLFEALWMLAGRNDVESVARYAKQMTQYSDDGKTFHGAYGYRWRKHFGNFKSYDSGIGGYEEWTPIDQLELIAESLQKSPDDRRQVLEMWDATVDLGRQGKDLPCNLMATFQINTTGALDLSVFCRSNDIVWGCYGANAVHFSFLLEYMARWIGVPVGRYSQISINWHGYLETFQPLQERSDSIEQDPYVMGEVRPLSFPDGQISDFKIHELLKEIENHQLYKREDEFWRTVSTLFFAHEIWRTLAAPERYDRALFLIRTLDPQIDFVRACSEWLYRRKERWEAKLHANKQQA